MDLTGVPNAISGTSGTVTLESWGSIGRLMLSDSDALADDAEAVASSGKARSQDELPVSGQLAGTTDPVHPLGGQESLPERRVGGAGPKADNVRGTPISWVPRPADVAESDFSLSEPNLVASTSALVGVGGSRRRHTRSQGSVQDHPHVQDRPLEYKK